MWVKMLFKDLPGSSLKLFFQEAVPKLIMHIYSLHPVTFTCLQSSLHPTRRHVISDLLPLTRCGLTAALQIGRSSIRCDPSLAR